MIHEAEFPALRKSVPSARRFAAEAVVNVPGEISDAVALIATELASNSVQHAASAFAIRVEQLPDRIRIEVEDDGEGQPVIGSPGLSDTSGRGLRIVDALADVWGVIPKEEASGKTVWVNIALDHSGSGPLGRSTEAVAPERRTPGPGRRSGSPGSETILVAAGRDRDTTDPSDRRAHRLARHCRLRSGATALKVR